jgi:hypothetical protein
MLQRTPKAKYGMTQYADPQNPVEQSNSMKPSSKRRKNEKSVRNILRLRTSPYF